MLTDLMAHDYVDDPKRMDEVVDDDFDPDAVEDMLNGNGPGADDWEDL
jgi:hypothetical protein